MREDPPPPDEPGRESPDRGSPEPGDVRAPSIPRVSRLVLFAVGGLLLFIGLVGLALPVIPQTIPLALGVALLSLASERVHRYLKSILHRWPRIWRTIQAFRNRLESWLSR